MTAALRAGLIGTGFMGRAHAIAMHSVGPTFGAEYRIECALLADSSAASAERAAQSLGFARSTGDWRDIVSDPNIDLVDICTPNHLHAEMALAALAAGKHVYCEKPLALDLEQSIVVAEAAERSGVHHAIGFNYICNPMMQVARQIIQAGELGEIVAIHGRYFEDYMCDPRAPYTWRCQRHLAGSGALADLGSHLINMTHFLLGPIARVSGGLRTIHRQRVEPVSGLHRPVENDDMAWALMELRSGVAGTIEISRIAAGFKCGLGVQVHGTRGTLTFDQERMNELRLYRAGDAEGRRGFRTILAGPEHPDYAAFCPAPGHGLGINDLKVIEVRNVVQAIRTGEPAAPDFTEGLRVQRVMTAIEQSAAQGRWLHVDEVTV